MLDRAHLLASLRRDVDTFGALLREADLALPVPDCDGWTVADLARHLGGVHRWARGAVVEGRPGDVPTGPDDPAALVAWFAEGAEQLLDTLATTDPDAPCWTFGPEPRTASFWVRRQAHETSMHLRDLQRAIGVPAGVDRDLAVDGVDEVVTMFFPRQVRLGRTDPLGLGVHLRATDAEAAWLLAGDGLQADAPFVAALTGTAESLLLWLWGRTGGDEPEDSGQREAIDTARAAALTP